MQLGLYISLAVLFMLLVSFYFSVVVRRKAVYLRNSMELLWFRISNEPDNDGLDLDEELYWVYIAGYRQIIAITNMEAMEELGDSNGVALCTIKLCKSRNSEIVRWYI